MGQTVACISASAHSTEDKLIECAVSGDLIGTDKWAEKALREAALKRAPPVTNGTMEIIDASTRRSLEEDKTQCEVV